MSDNPCVDELRRPLREQEDAVAQLTAPGQLYELEEVVIRGHAYRSYRNQPANLAGYFAGMLHHSGRDWVVMGDERYTYEAGYRLAAAFATALQQRYQVSPGDRVAIVMRNNPQWMIGFIGTLLAGAIAVPVNAWWTTEELEYGLHDCGAGIAVVDPERAGRLEPIRESLGLKLIGVGEFGALIPAHIGFHQDKLPRIASGKIFKRQLKADYAAGLASQQE